MSNVNLKDYVTKVVEVESSCYSQRKAIDAARAVYSKKSKQCPSRIEMPKLKDPGEYTAPIKPRPPRKSKKYWVFRGIGLGLIGFSLILLLSSFASSASQYMVFVFVIMAIAGIVLLTVPGIILKKKSDRQYQAQLKQYEDSYNETVRNAEEAYARAVDQYLRDKENFEMRELEVIETNKRNYELYNNSLDAISSALKEMNDALTSTETTLEKLYSLNIVYPKYRNLIAMTTIAEYLDSGRCSELEGTNGAYNLYESELRQNVIINKLDTVITTMEQIKQNQYRLYTEVEKSNLISAHIALEMNRIAETASRIEAHAAITSYCAQITAENEMAQTALAIWY